MVNYRRGYLGELKAVRLLEAEGYTVARTAGSHSPFDVVAVGRSCVRLIQVKRVKRGGVHPALEEGKRNLSRVPCPPCTSREVWVWVDGKGWAAQQEV
ncbi:MAG: hypothetical protein ACPLPR_01395 [Bacillota bacterium]